ncbi:N-hydroxyarylamine O-acetyltransferase [Acetivibrio straminisolvens JCM 21531]|uniref:N-hydroxyarylamine O-acetyltransferase n=1 Tax=Acetivibrio straminisolvens JCM 21531 TaxID=1294263 RepID=W4V1W5_9FIRM|nr:N-hydroxyarylamine O-acetyltransferase [Acetivibrio straminisolvens JCM 21531]
MAGNELNLEACLHRIKYSGKIDVSADTLQGLHICYTTNVPFENLDIIRGKEILLDNKSLFKKIVLRKRGGCCFEMNFFFEFILKSLGFKVRSFWEDQLPIMNRLMPRFINYCLWKLEIKIGSPMSALGATDL